MNGPRLVTAALVFAAFVSPRPADAGSFFDVAVCDTTDGCLAGVPKSDPDQTVPPFAITHPLGYDRLGGTIQIPVCVSSTSPTLIGPTQRAIATWNALEPTTENCLRCTLWEEPGPVGDVFHAESIILHELGHCAMGLDHPDRNWDADNDGEFEFTSFTRSWGAVVPGGITAGADGIRGSRDDLHEAPGGPGKIAESVSWFRRADNNPVIVDATVIDQDTYSRSVAANLPPGDTWAASGNRLVAESLGTPFTQAVMYSRGVPGMQYSGLSADEVNMVRMGMSGEDLMAGTADDYTVELVYVADCATDPSAIVVRFVPFDGPTAPIAECRGVAIDYAFPPPNPVLARHFELVELITSFAPQIRLDSNLNWDTGPPIAPVVFRDGFESGDLSEWSETVPIAN
jgi:hypothetical protein